MLFPQWLVTRAPEFSHRKTPKWANGYFIGDAAGSIPPATGNGLSMALSSGIMAAKYAVRGDANGFRRAWKLGRTLSRIYMEGDISLLASGP